MECGCKINRGATPPHPPSYIEFCPKHAEVDNLLTALEEVQRLCKLVADTKEPNVLGLVGIFTAMSPAIDAAIDAAQKKE